MNINTKILIIVINIAFLAIFLISYSVFAEEMAISGTEAISSFKECEVCPEMVIIPSGKIDYKEIDTNSKFSQIIINKPFAMSIFEVTWSEWLTCVKQKICKKIPSDQGWGKKDLPIINISWFDALDYIRFLNQITDGNYRLPSEQEWQYAARSNTKSKFWWGNTVRKNYANCRVCGTQWDGKQSSPVGSFKPNYFGLYDMNGNVWEWTSDCWFNKNHKRSKSNNIKNRNSCDDRVIKSGSWYYIPKLITPEARSKFPADLFSYNIGFRVIKDLN
ncbi:MAG: hypothetical protein CFH01_00826 [Alphaproteobacteria bacterium MarineAlpha2_Bin1]|nr:MAG: hypothetical protein CFH01_00826 [Alphaproteobacteria bacterium MarineAlpha2_Bin1]